MTTADLSEPAAPEAKQLLLSGVRDLWVDKHKHVFCLWGSNHLKCEQKRKPQANTPAPWEARDTLAEGVNK